MDEGFPKEDNINQQWDNHYGHKDGIAVCLNCRNNYRFTLPKCPCCGSLAKERLRRRGEKNNPNS